MPALINRLKRIAAFQIFTIYLRYLIGGAFVIAAIVMGKISNEAMPIADTTRPIGELVPMAQFFRVMSESGLYWHFIGWTQILTGFLLMTQRQAKLGALLFFGLITNIFVITVSYHFEGTPWVTGLMLLANIYLIVWDFQSFLFLVKEQHTVVREPLTIINRPYWSWLGLIMVISVFSLALLRFHIFVLLGVPFFEGFIGFILFFLLYKTDLHLSRIS